MYLNVTVKEITGKMPHPSRGSWNDHLHDRYDADARDGFVLFSHSNCFHIVFDDGLLVTVDRTTKERLLGVYVREGGKAVRTSVVIGHIRMTEAAQALIRAVTKLTASLREFRLEGGTSCEMQHGL